MEGANNTVDGLRLVVFPIIFRVLYIPGAAGFYPSTVWFMSSYAYRNPGLRVMWPRSLKHILWQYFFVWNFWHLFLSSPCTTEPTLPTKNCYVGKACKSRRPRWKERSGKQDIIWSKHHGRSPAVSGRRDSILCQCMQKILICRSQEDVISVHQCPDLSLSHALFVIGVEGAETTASSKPEAWHSTVLSL